MKWKKMRSSQFQVRICPFGDTGEVRNASLPSACWQKCVMNGLLRPLDDEDYPEFNQEFVFTELVPGIPATAPSSGAYAATSIATTGMGSGWVSMSLFINANCTFLDGGYITIGAHTLVGPCVQIYTPSSDGLYRSRKSWC